MFASAEDARQCAKGDVILVQSLDTGLIFNSAFEPQLLDYDQSYQNEQAVSAVFRNHLAEVANIIERHFRGELLVEVGCGKGYFLELLQGAGHEIIGLDPAYEGSNSSILKKYFTPETGVHAGGVVLRHVLEHVQDPVTFLSEIRDANGGQGKIYIEVPCFDWICERRAWFDIFYEHVNYFRLSDFHRMFGTVYESGHVFGGQYLFAVADLSSIRKPECSASDWLEFPPDFLATVDQYASRLQAQPAANAAVWGGASKGTIFALFMQRAGAEIEIVIDMNPAKQGKYLPATGLRVWSPIEARKALPRGAHIYVMNSNYLPEITELTNSRFKYFTVDHGDV